MVKHAKRLSKQAVNWSQKVYAKKEGFKHRIKQMGRDENGGLLGEYGLLIALALVVIATAGWAFGDDVKALFMNASKQMQKGSSSVK